MILVTAAGGMTGMAVTAELRRRGHAVRALVHSERAAPALADLGSEVVVGALLDDDVIRSAMTDCTALYLIWPNFDPDEYRGATSIARHARDGGVGRIVYHSVLRPHLESMAHHWHKMRVEEYLDSLGIDYRVLQPAAYLDNIGRQIDTVRARGRFVSPWGVESRLSFVDLRDVADAAVTLLTTDGLDRGVFEACGPDQLTAEDIARALEKALGHEVVAVDERPGGSAGRPEDYGTRCLVSMSDYYRRFGFVGTSFVLSALLGRPAHTLDDYVETLPI